MTYIIANTITEGKHYCKTRGITAKVLSTGDSIRGRRFEHEDEVLVLTTKPEVITTLIPALCGARVYS